MSGVKEIKKRIKSVTDTQKITRAMYLVSSAKLTWAKSTVLSQRAYSDCAREILSQVLSRSKDKSFRPSGGGEGADAILILGSDKGLCADYNKGIAKYAAAEIGKYSNPRLYVSGARVRALLCDSGFSFDESFDISVKKPDAETASEIADFFKKLFIRGEISSFSVVYADFSNKSKPVTKKLLPFDSDYSNGDGGFDFLPDCDTLLDSLLPLCLQSEIMSCILSSFCSEQNARMMAMKNANDNASDLLSELRLEYNHTRQNAITGEITEISGERNMS